MSADEHGYIGTTPKLIDFTPWLTGATVDSPQPDADLLALSEQCVEAAMQLVRAQIPHMVETFIIKEGVVGILSKCRLREFGAWASSPDAPDEEDAT